MQANFERLFLRPFWSNLRSVAMRIEDPLVELGRLLFAVGRSNATLMWLQAVVVPLLSRWGDECVGGIFAGFYVVGAVATILP